MENQHESGKGRSHIGASATELLRAATNRDRAAWEELIGRYGGVVRSAVASFRLTEHDAADAAQNTWLRLLGSASTIRDPEGLGGWLATTARRECLSLIRRSRPEMASDTVGPELPAPGPTPESIVIADEAHRAVRTAVGELRGRPAQLIDALFFQPQTSYTQLSRRTGVPIGSIGPTRARALQDLRSELLQWV